MTRTIYLDRDHSECIHGSVGKTKSGEIQCNISLKPSTASSGPSIWIDMEQLAFALRMTCREKGDNEYGYPPFDSIALLGDIEINGAFDEGKKGKLRIMSTEDRRDIFTTPRECFLILTSESVMIDKDEDFHLPERALATLKALHEFFWDLFTDAIADFPELLKDREEWEADGTAGKWNESVYNSVWDGKWKKCRKKAKKWRKMRILSGQVPRER